MADGLGGSGDRAEGEGELAEEGHVEVLGQGEDVGLVVGEEVLETPVAVDEGREGTRGDNPVGEAAEEVVGVGV